MEHMATKAGQIGLTKALSLDLAVDRVRVNAVAPSSVLTPLLREWADTQGDPGAALAALGAGRPLGRLATAEDVGEMCAFLASDEAALVTGQVLCTDTGGGIGHPW